MKILIDNGHGIETPGKRSPDGVLREYAWNRLIASRIVDRLLSLGLSIRIRQPVRQERPVHGIAQLNQSFLISRSPLMKGNSQGSKYKKLVFIVWDSG